MIEERLRSGARELASFAPDGATLAEQIIAASQAEPSTQTPRRRTPRWQRLRAVNGWVVPVAAALILVVVVAGTVLGIRAEQRSQSDRPTPPAAGVPAGFKATDISFLDALNGWAIGSAPCPQGSCVAVTRTNDGGLTWLRLGAPALAAGYDLEIRFATASIGYVYEPAEASAMRQGRGSIFMTTDGGRTWHRQAQPVSDIAIAGDFAVAVLDSDPSVDCLVANPCALPQLLVSHIGSDSWQHRSYLEAPDTSEFEGSPGLSAIFTGSVVSAGPVTVLSIAGAPFSNAVAPRSSVAVNNPSRIFVSTDAGAHWTDRGTPCGSTIQSIEATSVEPDGSITVACTTAPTDSYVVRRADGPESAFKTIAAVTTSGYVNFMAGFSTGAVLLNGIDLSRISAESSTTGSSAAPVPIIDGPKLVSALQVTGPTSAVVVEYTGAQGGSNRLWTTADSGVTWTLREVK